MTADKPPSAAAEPSMEDILASIRRILSEDDTETGTRARDDNDEAGAAAERTGDGNEHTEERLSLDWQPPAATDETPSEEGKVTTGAEKERDNYPEHEVFLLTPTMKQAAERKLLSTATAVSSTDVLAQLAKAILDRRDIALGARDVTLEDMVRSMLKPLLKEWLDRNLPYLIERLVKKEIDIMVNRAERLD
jgi:cell pole-organizing protein PopZ